MAIVVTFMDTNGVVESRVRILALADVSSLSNCTLFTVKEPSKTASE